MALLLIFLYVQYMYILSLLWHLLYASAIVNEFVIHFIDVVIVVYLNWSLLQFFIQFFVVDFLLHREMKTPWPDRMRMSKILEKKIEPNGANFKRVSVGVFSNVTKQ